MSKAELSTGETGERYSADGRGASSPVDIDFAGHPHVSEIEEMQTSGGCGILATPAASNAAERRAHARALPTKKANAKAETELDIPAMPATKRRASDEAWNKERQGGARARVDNLKATMNEHLHITSTIVFEAYIAALHSAAEE